MPDEMQATRHRGCGAEARFCPTSRGDHGDLHEDALHVLVRRGSAGGGEAYVAKAAR